MNNKTYLSLLLITVLFFACRKETEPPILEDLSVRMLEKVNQLRSAGCRCGTEFMPPVQPLKWNIHLEQAAKAHAQDMSNKNYFDHTSPTGSIAIQRAHQAGYTGSYVMENIGKGYATTDAVMNAWQNSESHCRAIMDSMHREMGAARVGIYWVQEFGRP